MRKKITKNQCRPVVEQLEQRSVMSGTAMMAMVPAFDAPRFEFTNQRDMSIGLALAGESISAGHVAARAGDMEGRGPQANPDFFVGAVRGAPAPLSYHLVENLSDRFTVPLGRMGGEEMEVRRVDSGEGRFTLVANAFDEGLRLGGPRTEVNELSYGRLIIGTVGVGNNYSFEIDDGPLNDRFELERVQTPASFVSISNLRMEDLGAVLSRAKVTTINPGSTPVRSEVNVPLGDAFSPPSQDDQLNSNSPSVTTILPGPFKSSTANDNTIFASRILESLDATSESEVTTEVLGKIQKVWDTLAVSESGVSSLAPSLTVSRSTLLTSEWSTSQLPPRRTTTDASSEGGMVDVESGIRSPLSSLNRGKSGERGASGTAARSETSEVDGLINGTTRGRRLLTAQQLSRNVNRTLVDLAEVLKERGNGDIRLNDAGPVPDLDEGGMIDLLAQDHHRVPPADMDVVRAAIAFREVASVGADSIRLENAVGRFQAFEVATSPSTSADDTTIPSATATAPMAAPTVTAKQTSGVEANASEPSA